MAEFIVLSKMTLTMEEGTLARWFIKEGDTIKADDPLCSIENEKETEDLLSIYEGTILKIIAEEGEVYQVSSPLAIVGQPDEDYAALLAGLPSAEAEQTPSIAPINITRSENAAGKMMPKVRKLIRQKGLDMDALVAFCGNRKITEEEVLAFEESARGESKTNAEVYPGDEIVKMSGMRKSVMKNMKESRDHTASLTNFMEADLTDAFAAIQSFKNTGKRVSVTAFIIKAVAYALQEHKIVNTVCLEDSEQIIFRKDINVACAVDIAEGLAVPVIRNADQKDVLAITAEIDRFAEKGCDNKISNEDMQGGTFTVSNVGMLDILTFTPIINYPQTAILGVGTVRTLPRYADDDCTVIVPRKIMHLAITYDHRVIDGAPASRFLQCVKAYLETPEKLL